MLEADKDARRKYPYSRGMTNDTFYLACEPSPPRPCGRSPCSVSRESASRSVAAVGRTYDEIWDHIGYLRTLAPADMAIEDTVVGSTYEGRYAAVNTCVSAQCHQVIATAASPFRPDACQGAVNLDVVQNHTEWQTPRPAMEREAVLQRSAPVVPFVLLRASNLMPPPAPGKSRASGCSAVRGLTTWTIL